ncbi:MAG: YlxM family DNA-binding protein [Clostridia bacterium]|nr:YlxM family DNA-binding protein [Clostridia bacterium]
MPKNMEIALLFDFYGEMLTEKQRHVVELYYEEDLSLAEIAESQSITRQGVRDSIKRAEAQMLEMEERLQLAARFREMRDGFSDICRAAYEIQVLNDRYGYSREVDERAKRIIALAEQLKER